MPVVGSSRNNSSGLPNRAIGRFGESDPFQQLSGRQRVGCVAGEQVQQFQGARPGVAANAVLQHHPDPRTQRGPVQDRIAPENPYGSAVGPAETLADLDGGGLAGTVGTQQREQAALRHGQRDTGDGGVLVIAFDEILDLDGGDGHALSLGSRRRSIDQARFGVRCAPASLTEPAPHGQPADFAELPKAST
jgi:hypothetical protein